LIELNKELKKRGIPLVYTVHGRDSLYDPLSQNLMEISDLVTSPSYSVIEEVRQIIPNKKTLAVPNSTDFTDYRQNKKVIEMSASFRKSFKGDSENKIVLSVGRLQEDKGVYETAEAVVNLINNGKNINMVHAGPCFNGEDKKRLEYIFNDYPDRLEIVGQMEKEDLPALYKAGDVLILPSDMTNETFGLVALEALAMETPVIVSDMGGPKEVFVDPGLAIGVSPRNVKSIENGINYVMGNYSQEKKRAEEASRIIEKYYHTDFISELWLGIYDKLRENSN
jgi:glycosyltransferase involved in cell wall biosynthesis